MLFDSYVFIFCFLPIVLLGYYLFTKKKQYSLAISWIVTSSLFFYGWWNPKYLILLLVSITSNYLLGYILWQRAHKKKKNKTLLIAGIFLNLLFIGYFKYAYFLISNINLFISSPILFEEIILPLGISFFTFQKIAFLVDASRGEIKNYRFSEYCLFVTFFPQLIAGPIVQHKQIIPQLSNKSNLKISSENFSIGITIFIIGLLKKIALADSIAVYANVVFSAAATGVPLTFWETWCGALSYSLQLYFDFSGYSDMALGLAYLFGIKLPINFNSPYKAKSIIDFWRRWHMTLSAFLRDYLYIPLGGNRKGPLSRYINLIITMLLGGLWHGANWTFVFWGALHGAYLSINHLWRGWSRSVDTFGITHTKFFAYGSQIVTLLAVITAWIPFRADNILVAKTMIIKMYTFQEFSLPSSIQARLGFQNNTKGIFANGLADWNYGVLWIIGLLLVALFMPNTMQLMRHFFSNNSYEIEPGKFLFKNLAWQPNVIWAILMSMGILVAIMLLSEQTEFLYFQF